MEDLTPEEKLLIETYADTCTPLRIAVKMRLPLRKVEGHLKAAGSHIKKDPGRMEQLNAALEEITANGRKKKRY